MVSGTKVSPTHQTVNPGWEQTIPKDINTHTCMHAHRALLTIRHINDGWMYQYESSTGF